MWVTDAASGETGHLSFDLTAWLLTALPQSTSSELVFGGDGGGTLDLGGNRYDLRLSGSDGDSGQYVGADLTVGPAAATPEPGTLALAGLGLGAVGLLRARRRCVRRPRARIVTSPNPLPVWVPIRNAPSAGISLLYLAGSI